MFFLNIYIYIHQIFLDKILYIIKLKTLLQFPFYKKLTISYLKKPYLNWRCIWDKVFKNGPRNICGRQSLKHLKNMACLPQILLGPFLNTLSHLGP